MNYDYSGFMDFLSVKDMELSCFLGYTDTTYFFADNDNPYLTGQLLTSIMGWDRGILHGSGLRFKLQT